MSGLSAGRARQGFTLIELVIVLALLGILATIGAQFVLQAATAYQRTSERSRLIAGGRVAVERMARQVQAALPNSVRVTNSGNCVEFVPVVAGGGYVSDVPDASNGASAVTSIETGGYTIGGGTARYLYIGVQTAGEAYSSAGYASISGSETHSDAVIELAASSTFIRNSESSRFFLADNPEAYCLASGALYHYQNYGTPAASSGIPGGTTTLLAEQVSSAGSPFVLSQGTEDRNALLAVALQFSRNDETVTLSRDIMVRNVY